MSISGWTRYDEADQNTWPPPRWDDKGDVVPDRSLLVLDWSDVEGSWAPHVVTRWFWQGEWWDVDGNDRSFADDRPDYSGDSDRYWRLMLRDLPGRPT